MAAQKLTEKVLTGLPAGSTAWDTEVRGLGARKRGAEGDVVFVFKYRSPNERDETGRGRQRFISIGRWGRGDYGIDDARKAATAHRDAVRLERDPATERDARKAAMTVSELCDAYVIALPTLLVRRAGRAKKPSTVLNDKSRIEAHIKPLIGGLSAAAISQRDVRAFMHKVATGVSAKRKKLDKKRALSNVRGGQGVATRTMGLLGAIFTYAVNEGVRTDNPVHGVQRFADKKRERRLSDVEYGLLGAGLRLAEASGVNSTGLAAARLLMLTGWRLSDATKLKWSEVDAQRRTARLTDTKTDASARPLSAAALKLVLAQPRTTNPYVFPARVEGAPLQGLPRMWQVIREKAGLPDDVTLHVLRHSFASVAADLGYGDAAIAALIGHKRSGITARYTHMADAVVLKAADEVAATIERFASDAAREVRPSLAA